VAVGLDEAVRGSDAHEGDGGAHDEDPPGIHVVRVRVRVRARARARVRVWARARVRARVRVRVRVRRRHAT
jgi:hypothetical protein